MSTYIHCDWSMDACHDLGSDIAGTQYDVAHVKWGGNWAMPSPEQTKELLDNCILDWTTISDVCGGMFTSRANKNYIFLPAAGLKSLELLHVGKGGYYWLSTLHPADPGNACQFHFYSGGLWWDANSVHPVGNSIRPVCLEKQCR